MAAATTERKTQRLATRGPGGFRNFSVAAGVKCFEGTLAALNAAGFVQPATTATGLKLVGVFDETVDNTDGANGDKRAEVRKDGAFGFDSAGAADAIDGGDIGATVYAVDDQTVGLTSASSSRSEAGKVYDVKNGQIFIEFED
jgi:hypothetical protein